MSSLKPLPLRALDNDCRIIAYRVAIRDCERQLDALLKKEIKLWKRVGGRPAYGSVATHYAFLRSKICIHYDWLFVAQRHLAALQRPLDDEIQHWHPDQLSIIGWQPAT